MLSNEFKINEVDKYIYVKNMYKDYVIVCLYVDNILFLGNDNRMVKSIKKYIN
jgi:hypothetical protein